MTQIIIYDQTGIHVDGYKRIISFDSSMILLQCKKKKLIVTGNALAIASFTSEEILIRGEILSVNWSVEDE